MTTRTPTRSKIPDSKIPGTPSSPTRSVPGHQELPATRPRPEDRSRRIAKIFPSDAETPEPDGREPGRQDLRVKRKDRQQEPTRSTPNQVLRPERQDLPRYPRTIPSRPSRRP